MSTGNLGVKYDISSWPKSRAFGGRTRIKAARGTGAPMHMRLGYSDLWGSLSESGWGCVEHMRRKREGREDGKKGTLVYGDLLCQAGRTYLCSPTA